MSFNGMGVCVLVIALVVPSGDGWIANISEVSGVSALATELEGIPDAVRDAAALATGLPSTDFRVIVQPPLDLGPLAPPGPC